MQKSQLFLHQPNNIVVYEQKQLIRSDNFFGEEKFILNDAVEGNYVQMEKRK